MMSLTKVRTAVSCCVMSVIIGIRMKINDTLSLKLEERSISLENVAAIGRSYS